MVYKESIVKGCVKKEGKLVCYAYDLSTLPPGADDPELASRKCVIVFDGNVPQFRVTGNAEALCLDLLKDLGSMLKKSKDVGMLPIIKFQDTGNSGSVPKIEQ